MNTFTERLTEPEEIGRRLKQARRRKNLTQRSIAKKLGVTHKTLVDYEKGRHSLNAIRLSCFCYALDCSADWVLGLTEDFKAYPQPKGSPSPSSTPHQSEREP
jgi:transcriptional regulator with XRE-family HTH domain